MIEKIETEAEHKAALARIELLFDAPEGSPEYAELIRLADLVNDYEDIHYPIGNDVNTKKSVAAA